jgi:hypothetical protein
MHSSQIEMEKSKKKNFSCAMELGGMICTATYKKGVFFKKPRYPGQLSHTTTNLQVH